MNVRKTQAMDMNLDKIVHYSCYVDCFSRILREFLENGYDNLKTSDIINIASLLEKYSHRLYLCTMSTQTHWEFSK